MTAKHAKKFSKATYKPIAPLALWRIRTRLPYLELEF